MTTIKRLSLYLGLGAFVGLLGLTSCSKRNPELEADYATKKASAETLLGQITGATTTMKDDHTKWTATLDDAAKKPGADTAKLNALRGTLSKHEADMASIVTLEDSVKAYMNATSDKADEFKTADDKLGSNFNDLSDKWKSFQDAHSKLGQDITAAAAAPPAEAPKPKPEAKKPLHKAGSSVIPRKSAQ